MFENISKLDLSSLDFNEGVILNVNKPSGLTSFGVVRKIRGWTRCKKVGHAGTLDPGATGVLLVVTGKATKKVDQLMGLEKEYKGTILLGITTDTDDAEGRIIEEKEVSPFSEDKINKVLKGFTGEIEQIPPMYSALKINGQPLYKLARKGKVVERKPRKVIIHSISVDSIDLPCINVTVRCSKGTYIRALARDIGEKLGVGGHLKSLVRTRIGGYKVEDALSLDDIREELAVKK